MHLSRAPQQGSLLGYIAELSANLGGIRWLPAKSDLPGRGVDSHEELHDLEPLPFPELVIRLVLLYKHLQENPVTDELPKEEITGKVTPDDVETLCKYLYFADQSYDCGTEENLKEVLDEHGKDLELVKFTASVD